MDSDTDMPSITGILVGLLPPPLTGQTIASELACDGFREYTVPCQAIDLSGGEHLRGKGTLPLRLCHETDDSLRLADVGRIV